MGLFDWLVSDEQGAKGKTRRTSDPREVVLRGGRHGESIAICNNCDQRGKHCRCDWQ
jgi:hypothetical protein